MHDAYISLPGKARVDVDNQALTSITHSFSRSSPAKGVTRTAGLCRRRRRGRFRRPRPARSDRADGGHRQSRPGGARVACRRGGPGADQPARTSARDVRLAGVGQSVRRDAARTAHHRRVHRVERRWQRVARTPDARRAAEGDAACRGRHRLAADADPGRRDRRADRGWAVHPVLRPSRHLALRRDGQRRGQRHHAGGRRGSAARRARAVAARVAAVLLVGTFAWPLFRIDLVCRSELGRAGTALRRACECRFHRRHRRGWC